MAGGVSGFAHAPVTKLLVLSSVALSLLTQSWLSARAPSHLLRTLCNCVVFQAPGDLIFGGGLLYHTKMFERLKGSRIHGSALLTCGLLSAALQLLSSMALGLPPQAPSIPHLAIYSSFVPFLTEVPALSHFLLFGKKFSDKAFVFLCAAELLYLSRAHAATSALCSLAAGVLYHSNLLGIKGWLIPDALCRLCDRTLGKLLYSAPPQLRIRQAASRAGGGRGGAAAAGPGAPPAAPAAPAAATVAVSPAAVEQLTAMGFHAHQAELALLQAEGDVQMALALLLSQDG